MLLGRHLEGRSVVEMRIYCRGVDPKERVWRNCVPRDFRLETALIYFKL